MAIFLFRNDDNPIDYCVTDTLTGGKLPRLPPNARWLYRGELQNALHAARFGVMDFEAAMRSIARRGYARYTDSRLLRNCN